MTDRKSKTVMTDNFEEFLQKSEVFIDKTLFIYEFVELTARERVIIARPRMWGKSLNLDMCRRFLQIEFDETGAAMDPDPEQPQKKTAAYELFTKDYGGTKLDIVKEEYADFVKNNLGRHPVLFLRLKEANGADFNKMHQLVLEILAPLFKKYQFLLNKLQNNPHSSEYKDFMAIMNRETDDTGCVRRSLELLIELLCKHFGSKVYVLIDDYDVIFEKMLLDWNNAEEIEEGFFVFGKMITAAFNSEYRNKTLAMGNLILDGSILEIGPSLCADLLEKKYANKFGITIPEAQRAMQQYGMIDNVVAGDNNGGQQQTQQCSVQQQSAKLLEDVIVTENVGGTNIDATKEEMENNYKKILYWCDGYTVPRLEFRLLNPHSLFQQLVEFDANIAAKIKSALRSSSWWYQENIIHKKIVKCKIGLNITLRNILHKLLQIDEKENHVGIVMNSFKISRDDFGKLRNVEAVDGIVETIIKFLFALGFVTIKIKESPNEKNVHSKYTIAIPNREASHQMHGLIHSSYLKIYKWNVDGETLIDNALKNLLEFCKHGDQEKSCAVEELKNAILTLIEPMRIADIRLDKSGMHENEFLIQLIIAYRAMLLMHKKDGKFGGEVGTKKDEEGGNNIGDEEDNEETASIKTTATKQKMFTGVLGKGVGGLLGDKLGGAAKKKKKGETWADIVFALSNVAIIIETKHDYAKKITETTGMNMAKKGLEQIFDRRYHRIFKNDANIEVIKSIGICFGVSTGGDKKEICIAAQCTKREHLAHLLGGQNIVASTKDDDALLTEKVGEKDNVATTASIKRVRSSSFASTFKTSMTMTRGRARQEAAKQQQQLPGMGPSTSSQQQQNLKQAEAGKNSTSLSATQINQYGTIPRISKATGKLRQPKDGKKK